MKHIALLGASGHGKVVAEIAELNGWKVTFFDDAWPKIEQVGSWPVVGTTDDLLQNTDKFSGALVTIGNNHIRFDKSKLLGAEVELATLIHPDAVVSRYAQVDSGTVVMAGAVINGFAKVGMAGIINTASTIDHDCELGACVHVSPGANLAGAVVVGKKSWIGIGSSIKECVQIGDNVIVGVGAAVLSNIPNHAIAVGVPAKVIKNNLDNSC